MFNQVSVTPLDNIAAFSKYNTGASRSAIPPFDHSNFSSPYPQDIERINGEQDSAPANEDNIEVIIPEIEQIDVEPAMDIGLGLSDASMSFLSLSLK